MHNVLSPEEILSAKKMMIEWEKGVPGLQTFHTVSNPHCIYKFHEVGHQPHAWYIRTRPAVQQIYKDIWGTDELVTSFDGSCYMPSGLKKADSKQGWTHVDQCPNNSDRHMCYQGYVSLTSNKERTIRVYEGSHLLYNEYCRSRGLSGTKNWIKIEPDYLESVKSLKKVLHVPAGSLVLWDSRTFHQNQYGKPGNNEERRIQYVCFLPKNNRANNEKMREKRLKYFNERRTTSHWPYPIQVNGKQPQTYGDDSRVIDYSKLAKPDLGMFMDDILKII